MMSFSKSAKVFYRANRGLILSSIFVVLLLGIGGFWYWQRTAPLRIERQKMIVADVIAAGDIEQCAKARGMVIGGDDWEKVCKNNIALQQAGRTLELSQCDKLDGDFMEPEACKRGVIYKTMVRNPNGAFCLSLGEGALSDFCHTLHWTESAIAKNDMGFCDNHQDSARIARCRDEFFVDGLVFGRKEVSCDVFSEALRAGCLAYTGEKHSSEDGVSACLTTGNRSFEQICLSRYRAYETKRVE